MAEAGNPSELAREALRRLAMQRIPPTPDNYAAVYHEIAGTTAAELFPERSLKAVAAALPRATPEQLRVARQFESAVAEKNWDSLKSVLVEFVGKSAAEAPNWAALLRDLLAQIETRHAGITPAKKREALEHVLAASSSADILHGRLQSLLRNWSHADVDQAAPMADAAAPDETATAGRAAAPPPRPMVAAGSADLRELIAKLLEDTISVLLVDAPELSEQAAELARAVRAAQSPEELDKTVALLRKLCYRLHFVAEDHAELRGALQQVLRLIVENISELVVDDRWLHTQIDTVLKLFEQPLTLRRLDDVERRLKEVIYKQSNIKHQIDEANSRLKELLATFVDRLGEFAQSTGSYTAKIEKAVNKISQAKDISELTDVLGDVVGETRVIQLNVQRARDELIDMRQRVEEAEKEIERLQTELSEAGEMVRHDALTGALNRKGMDEALVREMARSKRHGAPMSLALLDIDNFKKLNDTLGHQAGDDALVHLASVVRETLRPQDTLARYGGEEFVIIMPDTALEDASGVMTRVQRQLTKRFFLHKNEKLLITFSAGVAELGPDEAAPEGIKRADAAMYLAKRAGKNRVVAG
jgi:diguanylate cyclase